MYSYYYFSFISVSKLAHQSDFAIMRILILIAPVAQLDRVLVSEAKGRGFDSRRARHLKLSAYSLNSQ